MLTSRQWASSWGCVAAWPDLGGLLGGLSQHLLCMLAASPTPTAAGAFFLLTLHPGGLLLCR
jgi:hypothetical protein